MNTTVTEGSFLQSFIQNVSIFILLAVFISLQSFILNVFLGFDFVLFLALVQRVEGMDDEMVEVEISHSKRPDIACQLGVDPVVFS